MTYFYANQFKFKKKSKHDKSKNNGTLKKKEIKNEFRVSFSDMTSFH